MWQNPRRGLNQRPWSCTTLFCRHQVSKNCRVTMTKIYFIISGEVNLIQRRILIIFEYWHKAFYSLLRQHRQSLTSHLESQCVGWDSSRPVLLCSARLNTMTQCPELEQDPQVSCQWAKDWSILAQYLLGWRWECSDELCHNGFYFGIALIQMLCQRTHENDHTLPHSIVISIIRGISQELFKYR